MSKQTPAELAAEQRAESSRWLWTLGTHLDRAEDSGDHDMTAALHRALRTAMQSIQRHNAKRREERAAHAVVETD